MKNAWKSLIYCSSNQNNSFIGFPQFHFDSKTNKLSTKHNPTERQALLIIKQKKEKTKK